MVEASRLSRDLGGPGFDLLERVRNTIDRFEMFESDAPCVVGVSGGPDSLCLLDMLTRLNVGPLIVGHVDHGLSETSEAVAVSVARLAAEAGLDVHVVRAQGLEGPNLQARARAFRYSFFETIMRETGADRIATGHTLDDRVETTLARFIHGGGTSVLAGLKQIEGDRVRPLIGLRRSETRRYCDERGLAYIDDPANEDPRFDRARIRKEIVSAIESNWGDGAIRAMATSIDRLTEDAKALEDLADSLYPALVSAADGGGPSFEVADLQKLPRALCRRLLERAVGRVRDRSGGIDAVLEAIEKSDKSSEARRFSVASGIEIAIEEKHLSVQRPGGEPASGLE